MYFTREDYLKIEEWLKLNAIKDTEFKDAELPVKELDTITLVQEGKNVKVSLKDFIDLLFNLGVSDFLNITDKYKQRNITIEQAISLIPSRARKKGQVITFLNSDGKWVLYQFKGELNQWNIVDLWDNIFDINKYIINSIIPDEEDLTMSLPDSNGNSYISLKGREYNPQEFSGKGRIILRKNIIEEYSAEFGKVKKNILVLDMINLPNTIYEIRYDFNLNGQEITIPEGCVLQFEGGSLSNGVLNGGIIKYSNYHIFKENIHVICDSNSIISPINFGVKFNEISDDTLSLNLFFKCIYESNCEYCNINGTSLISSTITIPCTINAPKFNIQTVQNFSGVAIYIDNYRYDTPQKKQNGENMIRDCIITLGNINTDFENLNNTSAIKISACRNIIINVGQISNFKNGLLLEGYDNIVGFISYSTFNIKSIINCNYGIKIRQFKRWDNSDYGWVTECVFNDTQISTPNKGWIEDVIYIDMQANNGNTIDGHTFNSLTMEGAIDSENHLRQIIRRWAIVTKKAISNTFYNCRFEVYKNGAIKRIINKENEENPYPNIFITMKSVYNTDIFDDYLNNIQYYVLIAPSLYNSNINTTGSLLFNNINYENKLLNINDIGLRQYGDIISVKPMSAASDRGIGIINIRSHEDWECEGNFILWTDNSNLQSLYFKKSKGDITTSHTTNFRDEWYRIKLINDSDREQDINVITPTKEMVRKPFLLQFFEGYEGLVYYNGKEWVNIYGTQLISGGLSQKPTSFRNGSFYLAKTDEYEGKPIWAIGGVEGTSEDDKWVRYDGESSNAVDIGSLRPMKIRHNGRTFYDTKIDKLICYKNDKWVDSNGNSVDALKQGTTQQRPIEVKAGFYYFDTTLNKPIWKKEDTGTIWVDATGAEV